MKTFFIFLVLGLVFPAFAVAEDELTTRRFHVLYSVAETAYALRDAERADGSIERTAGLQEITESEWKLFFAQLGMTWPEGSSIRYIPSTGHMVVKSTPGNLELFEKIISVPCMTPSQVEVEMYYVLFDREVIASLLSTDEAETSALLGLWRGGKGELVHAPRLLTRSGYEARLKPRPRICPQMCLVSEPSMVRSNTTVNTGTSPMIQVLPEVSPNGQMIMVTIATDTFSAAVNVIPGHPVLLYGGYPDTDQGKLQYVFLTARLLNIEGNRFQKPKIPHRPTDSLEASRDSHPTTACE